MPTTDEDLKRGHTMDQPDMPASQGPKRLKVFKIQPDEAEEDEDVDVGCVGDQEVQFLLECVVKQEQEEEEDKVKLENGVGGVKIEVDVKVENVGGGEAEVKVERIEDEVEDGKENEDSGSEEAEEGSKDDSGEDDSSEEAEVSVERAIVPA